MYIPCSYGDQLPYRLSDKPQRKHFIIPDIAAHTKKSRVDVTVDNRSEKIGFKIREARMDRLPYMLVVGQQEEADGTVSVRSRFAGDEGVKPLDEFIAQITEEIRTKAIRKEEVVEEKK